MYFKYKLLSMKKTKYFSNVEALYRQSDEDIVMFFIDRWQAANNHRPSEHI